MADFTFETSGDNGITAIDGESFSHILPEIGQNGINGRDATIPSRGFKGGTIAIKLRTPEVQNDPGHIIIEGGVSYENRPSGLINGSYFLGATGLINFISRGGNGGVGARGGNGQDGGVGNVGHDATEQYPATDGEPGGNGGDGGKGSHGGDGGNGGHVKVFTSEEDAHLLMLLGKYDLSGGRGGLPGSHGKAGCGGKGGVGGRGSGMFSPGNNGPDGHDGKTYSIPLYEGHEGLRGELEFGIVNYSGYYERRYDHTYRLEISDFKYEYQDDCGIIEPGSSISIVNMKFVNIGKSPTPKYTPIRIELDGLNNEYSDWIGNVTYLFAPYDIFPNDVKYLDANQRIIITINDLNIVNDGAPLYQPISLRNFRAIMTKIERPLETFNINGQVQFTIQQPINISEVIAIRSPGGLQYDVFWFVTNVSSLPFGRNSNCRRMIVTKLTKGESYGAEIDHQEIQLLNGRETVQITCRIQLEDDQPQQFTVSLQIGSNNYQPDVLKSIQTRRFVIQPTPGENKHLYLDVTKNSCTNINHYSTLQDFKGMIYLTISNASTYTTNIGQIYIDGEIRFTNGHIVKLKHHYSFESDGYIYITHQDSTKHCDVTIVTTEQESYLFALLKNTYDDTTNKINWQFQTINQTYNRINTYASLFKPRVVGYVPIMDNDTQIYEPNSKGTIQRLRIYNEGEMPTPNNHNIIIRLLPTENIIPNDDVFFIISKSIAYNSTFELENSTFQFSIRNNERGLENRNPLRIKDYFRFKAVVTTIEHTLPDFNYFENQEITVQYPIQIGDFVGFRHPSTFEEKYSIFWKVKNISNIEFGKNSEVGRRIETSLHNDDNDVMYLSEIDSVTRQNYFLSTTNVVINDKSQFNTRLRLGSTSSPEKLLPIQSYTFHLLPSLHDDIYKGSDLVFDLNAGRLTLENVQPDDYVQPGSFQLLMSTPKADGVKPGDVAIKGTLQYTNEWTIQVDDSFSLGLTGWIYLFSNGKNDLSKGKIEIKIAREDTHLLYLIDKSILQACSNQLYKVIDDMETPDTTIDYKKIYQFTLVDFDCVPEDDSGIYEPGARIVIRRIKVKNTGEMPTPTSHDVEITIDLANSTGISLPNKNKLKLPKHIKHDKQVVLNPTKKVDEICLEFQVNQQAASLDKPLSISGSVDLTALMFGINRKISGFTLPKPLNIQYPIQICPATPIKDFPYKDLTRITWKINNISQIHFGSESDSKRIVKVQVKINNMIPNDSLKFKTDQTLTTYEQEITLLNANQSKEMFCELVRTLSNDDPTIIAVDLSIILYLGSIEYPDKGTDIEIRKKFIEVSPSYKSNKDADFLLAVSPKTKKENVDGWKDLCRQLGLKMSLWDIKREGHFDLVESGVIEDTSGKAIVMINDELDDDNEKDFKEDAIKQTLDYLDPSHFYQAVNFYNIKFFVVGTIDNERVRNLFVPKMISSTTDRPIVAKIKYYMQQRGTIQHSAIMEKSVSKQPVKSAFMECVQTSLRPKLNVFTTDESYKEKKLKKLSKSLQKNYPGHRYVLVPILGSSRLNDKVILCDTASRTKQHLLYYNSDQMINIGETNKIGLLSCISFSKRLEILQNLFDTNKDPRLLDIHEKLVEADLAIELIGFCGVKEIHKDITADILLSHMELFIKFCEFAKNSRELSVSTHSVDWILGVFAKLRIILQFSKDSIINFKSVSRIKQLKTIVDNEYAKVFARFYNPSNKPLQTLLNKKIKTILSNEPVPANSEKFDYFKNRMIQILRMNNLKSDFELFNETLDFVLSDKDYNGIHEFHNRTSGTIERRKTLRQNQIRLLDRFRNEETVSSEVLNQETDVNKDGSGTNEKNIEVLSQEIKGYNNFEILSQGTNEKNIQILSQEIKGNNFEILNQGTNEKNIEILNQETKANNIEIVDQGTKANNEQNVNEIVNQEIKANNEEDIIEIVNQGTKTNNDEFEDIEIINQGIETNNVGYEEAKTSSDDESEDTKEQVNNTVMNQTNNAENVIMNQKNNPDKNEANNVDSEDINENLKNNTVTVGSSSK